MPEAKSPRKLPKRKDEIVTALRAEISTLPSGARLPGNLELCRRFHCAGKTITRAIGELELGLKRRGWHIISHDVSIGIHHGVNTYRVTLMIQKHSALNDGDLLNFVQQFPDITMEKIDSPK